MRRCFRRKVEEEPEPPAGWSTTKYALLATFAVLMTGPLLVLTIHQVCVSKCLIVRRLPKLNSEVDDVLLIALFVMFVTLNYITCSVIWSVLSKGSCYLNWTIKCTIVGPEEATLKDPKINRSGRPYGHRTKRYRPTVSRTETKPSLPEKSSWYQMDSLF